MLQRGSRTAENQTQNIISNNFAEHFEEPANAHTHQPSISVQVPIKSLHTAELEYKNLEKSYARLAAAITRIQNQLIDNLDSGVQIDEQRELQRIERLETRLSNIAAQLGLNSLSPVISNISSTNNSAQRTLPVSSKIPANLPIFRGMGDRHYSDPTEFMTRFSAALTAAGVSHEFWTQALTGNLITSMT
jgi:hypothetical protein